jgi:hypothetical protein
MATNCSSDITRVIDYMDSVLEFGTPSQVNELKTMFGMQDVEHNADFTSYG